MQRTVDVLVVGGGVIGSAVAFELARRGIQVELVDQSLPGRATSASAGGLWPIDEAVGLGCGVIYQKSNGHGNGHAGFSPAGVLPDCFRDFLVRSNRMFPQLAEELQDSTGIDIEYDAGAGLLFLIYDPSDRAFVDQVVEVLPSDHALAILTPEEAWRIEPRLTRHLAAAALLTGEHQVNPMQLAEGFKRAAMRHGASFVHDCQVHELRCQGDRVVGVRIDQDEVTCGMVVNAAGAWSAQLAATADIELPIRPVRGQIVLTEALPPTLNACLSTTGCYLAQKAHGEILVGSTTEDAGFDVSVTPDAITSLVQSSVRAVPALCDVGVKRVWAGLRPGTPDELPILGPVSERAGYINATGGFRTGIVASPLTGKVVAQCVVGEDPDVDMRPFLMDRFG